MDFDLSTGVCAGGAINIVTRTGSNQFHGSGFFFFRDHNMSAYPGLQRDPLAPDPFFARRQSGLWVGGQFPAAGAAPSDNIALWTGAER